MCEIIAKMVIDEVSYKTQDTSSKYQEISMDELFSSLPSRFKNEKANGVEMHVLFEFENDLNYFIEIKNQEVTVKSIDQKPTTFDLKITTDTQTYIDVETGKQNPQAAFMSGKIQVSDLGKMMQFGSLFRKLK
ncbi:MAG: SCP2 sterol-binding domain-containing protein [Chitinophagales bacterium]